MAVLVETTVGDLVIDLFVKERPKCSLNFLKLCKRKYYNLCQFHSIEQNYVAQTGDPTGTGRGGESIFGHLYGAQASFFEREDLPKMKHTRMGLVSFVNNGDDLLGSQFFITLGDQLDYLDSKHTIFGQVTEGLDTLEKLNETLCDENHKPFRDIRIAHTIIIDDPFEDSDRMVIPSRSPSPTYDQLVKANQIALDEEVDENEGKTAEEIAEEMARIEMEEQAQILEMVGDLRSADEAPPDNVLFVCKLNPVTTDEDLEIIFSRFGKIIKCEVIRDRRTKASLQYAFIEFVDPKACEQAYAKMDNVLIDDRRIHVDFSQSVAKNYQWDRKKNQEQANGNKVRNDHQKRPFIKKESPPSGGSPKRHRRGYSDRREKSKSMERRRRDRTPERRRDRTDDRERRRSPSPKRNRREEERKRRSITPKKIRKRSVTPERRRERTPEKKRKERSETPEKKRRKKSATPERRRKRSVTPEKRRREDSESPPRRRRDDSDSPKRRRRSTSKDRRRR